MTATLAALRRTPLFEAHRRLHGRLVDFAGWEMPVQYRDTGIVAEHLAVRGACGLFDLSHMGRVHVRGSDALALAQWCTTRDLAKVPAGAAAYTLLCREDGGILDDVIAYALGPDELLFVFNASNRERDVDWFVRQRDARGLRAEIDDRTMQTALIGIQGPNAQTVLQAGCVAELDPLPGYSFVQTEVFGRTALVARTGYTGEDGFEVLVQAADAEAVWDRLLAEPGVVACGLGARDTLRTEAAMALYGHEIDESTNPYEARLGWVVNLQKDGFVGQDALRGIRAEGPARKLVGLRVAEGGVPRPGGPIREGDRVVGALTSGTYSPTLRASIALGYVPTPLATVSQPLSVQVRGRSIPAEVVSLPFVPHRTRPRAGTSSPRRL